MKTQDINGTTLHYTDQGDGRPLVLLHGFPFDSRMWKRQVEALSRRCRVIAPDLRGFGESRSDDPFTMASLADDVEALLKRIDAIPCVLGGMSMGGYAALAYARKCPNHFDALILSDTRAAADSAEAREKRHKAIERVRSAGLKGLADDMLELIVTDHTRNNRPQLMAEIRSMMESCSPRTAEHALLAMRDRPDMTDFLPSIADPTLIITGALDRLIPPDVARAMHGQIPHSELIVIDGAAHLTQIEQPDRVNAAIEKFLDSF